MAIKHIKLATVIFSLLSSSYLFSQWTTVNVGTSDDLSAIEFKGSTIFLGGHNFVKSIDGGANWNVYPLLDDLDFPIFSSELYDIHFFDQNTGVATGFIVTANSEVILRTTNGGLNWSFVNVNNGGNWPRLLNDIDFPTSSIGFAVGTNGRLLKSVNAGQTWSSLASGTTKELFAVHFMSASTGIVVGDGLILKTTNGGNSWTTVNYPGVTFSDIHFINANVGMVSGSGGLLKTTNGGDSWTQIPGSLGGALYLVNQDTIFTGGYGIYESVNGGNYFLPQPSANGIVNELDFFNGTIGYAVGEDGFVTRTATFGDPFPLNDAGMAEIEPFPFNPCPDFFPVRTRLYNRGLNNLTQVTINWSVNGQLQAPFPWTGNLAATDSSGWLEIGNYFFPLGNNEVKVWTSLPNASADDFVTNDTIVALFSLNRLVGAYTIGGANADFPTISAAVAAAWYPGVCDTVVFNIRSGVYVEEITITETLYPPGNDYEIVFQSESGNPADVTLTAFPIFVANAPTLTLDGAKHITLQNLTIKSGGETFNQVLGIKNKTSDIHILNNVLEGKLTNFPTFDYAVAWANGSACNNITFDGNTIKNGSVGISLSGTPSDYGKGNIIKNNIFENQSVTGAACALQSGVVLTHNTISSYFSNSGAGIRLESCSGTFQVSKNRIWLNKGTGIFLEYCNISSPGEGWVTNNMVQLGGQIPSSDNLAFGIRVEQSHYLNIYFNSIQIQEDIISGSAALSLFYGDPNIDNTYVNVQNNIFSNLGAGGIYTVTHGPSPISINKVFNIIDNNAYYSKGDVFAEADVSETYNYSDYITSLELWKILLNKDFNSFLADPQFSGDLHIYPSTTSYLLNGVAQPIPGIIDDIDGEMRDPFSPDMGADEFDHPALDAGVARILGSSQYCAGSQPILVSIQNYGTDTLHQITVHWAINGVDQTPFPWSGSLAAGEQSPSLELGAYDFLPGNNYVIGAWTDSPNGGADLGPANNSAYLSITVKGMSGIYSIGGLSPEFQTFNAAKQALIANGVCGAVIFKVRPGIYFEKLSFPEITGASEANTITFESENGYDFSVELTYSANNATNFLLPTIEFNGADYFIFKNMTLSAGVNTQDFNQVVLYFKNGCSHNQFINNHFKGLDFPNNYNRLVLVYSDDNSIDEYNLFEGNRFTDGMNSISMRKSLNLLSPVIRHARGNRFINNIVSGAKVQSLSLGYQQDLLVEKNIINLSIAPWANYQQGGILVNGIGKTRVVGNKVIGSGGNGISVESWSSLMERSLTANNFVSLTSISGNGIGSAMSLGLIGGNDVFFNSLMIYGTIPHETRTLGLSYQPGSSIRVMNNNIINLTPTGQAVYGYFENTFESDYNNFFTAGGPLSVLQTDLAALQNGFGLDIHSRAVDPHFVSNTDLHLNSDSPVLDVGIPVPGVSVDYDGDLRNTVTPDIGADEFNILIEYSFENMAFSSAIGGWNVPANCGNEVPAVLPCDLTGAAVFNFKSDIHCTGGNCLSNAVAWHIFEGINLITDGVSVVSFNGNGDGQLDIQSLYSLLTPGVIYTLVYAYDCGECMPCDCTIKFMVAPCDACLCIGFYDLQFNIDGGAFVPVQASPLASTELSCPTGSGISFSFVGDLHCTDSCATFVDWEIRNSFDNLLFSGSAPLVWQGGSRNHFELPSLAFSNFQGFGFKLLLKGHCGELNCERTIRFSSPCDVCVCPTLSSMNFIMEGNSIPAQCNNQDLVVLTCPTTSGTFTFEGTVLCSDSCGAFVDFKILSFNDVVLLSGYANITPLGNNLYRFSLPGIPYNILPTFAFNKLVIGAFCSEKICSYCTINFSMPPCDFCCIYPDVFSQNIENAISIVTNNVLCNATLNIGGLPSCSDYIESVKWGDGAESTGPFTAGITLEHTYLVGGAYVVSYKAYELNDNGQVCLDKIFTDSIDVSCLPCDPLAPSTGLRGYFPFNGNANDFSLTAINGVVNGATLTIGHDNFPNSAYHFNGTSNLINCGGNNRGVTNEVSVLAWVKTSELTKGQWIAGKYNGFLGVGDHGYLLTIGDENNGNIGRVAFGGRDGSFFHWSSGYSQVTVNDGEWHCIVGVAGNGYWDVYVDGALANRQAGGTNNIATEANVPFSIGWNAYPFYPLWFNGDIDNVRVYNRALTAYEVECFSVVDTTITVSIIPIQNAEIRLFPNPTSGDLILEFTGGTPKSGTLQLLDLYGRIVRNETLLPGNETYDCSIANLPAGVYFAKVLDAGKPVMVEKFVKQ